MAVNRLKKTSFSSSSSSLSQKTKVQPQSYASWWEKSANLLGARKTKPHLNSEERAKLDHWCRENTNRVFSTCKTPLEVCLSGRRGFFQRTKSTKERCGRRKLNTKESSALFLSFNRPWAGPSAATREICPVYFAVETSPRALLY